MNGAAAGVDGAGASPPPAATAGAAAVGAAGDGVGSGAGSPPPPLSTVVLRHVTNWSMSFAETSAMTPRPNWATLPVTLRSVSTWTRCPRPVGGEGRDDVGGRVALSAGVAPLGAGARPCGRPRRPRRHGRRPVLRGDRADLHLHDAAVLVPVDLLELRAGHARRDALEVEEQRPGVVQLGGDLEVVLELHGVLPSTAWRSSSVSTSLGSPVPVQSTSTTGCRPMSARAPTSPCSVRASSQRARSSSTGLPRVPS